MDAPPLSATKVRPIRTSNVAAGGFPDRSATQEQGTTEASRADRSNIHHIGEGQYARDDAQLDGFRRSLSRWRVRADEKRHIDRLLAERAKLAVPISTIFLLFSALDWVVYPEHADRWLIYRTSIFGLVFVIDWLSAFNGRTRGFGLAALYAVAYSAAISQMTYESGGFASGYYVGLLVLAVGLFVVFPLDFRRGILILAMILAPYFLLNSTHVEIDVARVVNNTTFLLATVGFFVLGGHLGTRLLVQHYRDQARMRNLIEQLEDSSRRDPLTELFNRRHLNECLSSELPATAQQPPLTFAIADLDYFKDVNDRFGHQAGDHILTEVAHAIRASVRRDDVVFRYGGEEFAIIFPCTDAREARCAAERLRAAVENLGLSWNGVALELSASIGVTIAVPGDSPEAVVRRADKALYEAKNRGRNRIVVI